eukprot:TRINITY_DN4349_c0_g1_i4.p1 TRINITY_DN4349_c0_g1~~TRINITY_DN4349_c0_g1_i4.p1  ORF type:complete len:302 (-),score=69.93 TRINITY_DN4349_c0_g1_i4:597-1502(-)
MNLIWLAIVLTVFSSKSRVSSYLLHKVSSWSNLQTLFSLYRISPHPYPFSVHKRMVSKKRKRNEEKKEEQREKKRKTVSTGKGISPSKKKKGRKKRSSEESPIEDDKIKKLSLSDKKPLIRENESLKKSKSSNTLQEKVTKISKVNAIDVTTPQTTTKSRTTPKTPTEKTHEKEPTLTGSTTTAVSTKTTPTISSLSRTTNSLALSKQFWSEGEGEGGFGRAVEDVSKVMPGNNPIQSNKHLILDPDQEDVQLVRTAVFLRTPSRPTQESWKTTGWRLGRDERLPKKKKRESGEDEVKIQR